MSETVTLKCRCGNARVHHAPTVDIAEFLRCALGDGWLRVDPEPVNVEIERDRSVNIDLYGECSNCVTIERQEEQQRRLSAVRIANRTPSERWAELQHLAAASKLPPGLYDITDPKRRRRVA
ncbi:MAG: hypothetical protein WBQ86_09555 [Candidatus Binatus sp.]